jgi:tripartite-type tricarboxylate transporter receptor subunit TctC
MKLVHRIAVGLVLAAGVLAVPYAASADDYPNKPIRFIAPIPAGGSTEILARDVAQGLSERLKQPVVVENRPGGAGSIGSAVVASAPPDGYTILLVNSSHAINPHVYKNLPFDAIRDFSPVSLMTDLPMGLYVHPSVPAKNLEEFIAMVKAKPDGFSYATSGNGSAGHLTGQMFLDQTGLKMVHVPYRGSALAINDVLAGQVPVLVGDVPLAEKHVKSGALRALAVTSSARAKSLPDTPTFAELGLKDMTISIWIGVLASRDTPKEITKKLSQTIAEILKEPALAKKVTDRGFVIIGSTPEEFAAVIKKDYDRFGEVVRKSGLKAE